MRPLVSVIIPTRNRPRPLAEAVESVFAQQGVSEEFDIEVIVVDDASSDTTSDVATNYPRVRYIRLPTNRGVAAARNVGVKASSGEYVAFLDDDDIWLPHKLKQQIPPLKMHAEVDAVYSPCIVRFAGQEKVIPDTGHSPSGFVLKHLVKENLAPVHGYLLRRSAIERAGYFDEQLPCLEDWDLWLRIAVHGPFIFVPGCVGVYRSSSHGRGETAKREKKERVAYRRVLEKLGDLLKNATAPQDIIREGRARIELQLASLLVTEQPTLAQSHLLAALRIFPDLIHEAQTRQMIAWIVSENACRSAAPLNFTRTLSDEIKGCIRPSGIGQRIAFMRLFSDMWATLAMRLSFRPNASDRNISNAAILAVLYDPSKVTRKGLLWFMARRVIGRRHADALASVLRRRPQ